MMSHVLIQEPSQCISEGLESWSLLLVDSLPAELELPGQLGHMCP